MKTMNHDTGRVHPHLPHSALEMQSPPPIDARDAAMARRNADRLVSDLVRSQPVQPAPPMRQRVAVQNPQQPLILHQPVAAPAPAAQVAPQAHPSQMPQACAEDKARAILTEDPLPVEKPESLRPLLAAYGVLLAALVAVLLFPWLALTLALLSLVGLLSLPSLLRHPKAGRWLSRRWVRYATLRPERAERLRKGADKAAMVFDRLLDYLPGPLAERLAMPDFSQPIETGRG